MTPQERRTRITDLASRVREARNQDPQARYAVELVQLTYEDLKERLVDADDTDMYRLQGAARRFKQLHGELTRTPPNLAPNQET